MPSVHPSEITINGRRFKLVPIDDDLAPNDAANHLMIALARNLRAAREDAGLTQTELAKKLKLSQSFVAQTESGTSRVGEKYVLSVLKACNLPKDWRPSKKAKR